MTTFVFDSDTPEFKTAVALMMSMYGHMNDDGQIVAEIDDNVFQAFVMTRPIVDIELQVTGASSSLHLKQIKVDAPGDILERAKHIIRSAYKPGAVRAELQEILATLRRFKVSLLEEPSPANCDDIINQLLDEIRHCNNVINMHRELSRPAKRMKGKVSIPKSPIESRRI